MRLIYTLVGLALITFSGYFVSCNESSEEDVFKDYKKCPAGYCVPAHLCRNGSINDNGNDIIEIRFGDPMDPMELELDEQDDPCEEFLLRCCRISAQRTNKKPLPDDSDLDDDIQLPPPTCGTNHPNGYIYRVNKSKGIGQFGEFPWMAVLLQRRTLLEDENLKTLQYFCGGSLIHRQVILTAAHCVKSYTDALDTLVVRLGEWDTVTENEPLKHENYGVQKIILHEDYLEQGVHNDLALLILDQQANLNVHINPICLPMANDNFDSQRCMVSGWGKENFNPEGKYSEVLKKIEVPMISRKKCKQLFRATKLGPFFNFHNSFVCAGGEAGVDMCKGDGGSPLACERDGAFVQAGIVAWGLGCGGENVPGAYVNVSKFVDWINKKIQAEAV